MSSIARLIPFNAILSKDNVTALSLGDFRIGHLPEKIVISVQSNEFFTEGRSLFRNLLRLPLFNHRIFICLADRGINANRRISRPGWIHAESRNAATPIFSNVAVIVCYVMLQMNVFDVPLCLRSQKTQRDILGSQTGNVPALKFDTEFVCTSESGAADHRRASLSAAYAGGGNETSNE